LIGLISRLLKWIELRLIYITLYLYFDTIKFKRMTRTWTWIAILLPFCCWCLGTWGRIHLGEQVSMTLLWEYWEWDWWGMLLAWRCPVITNSWANHDKLRVEHHGCISLVHSWCILFLVFNRKLFFMKNKLLMLIENIFNKNIFISFIDYILLTKSLPCKVYILIGIPYDFKVFKYLVYSFDMERDLIWQVSVSQISKRPFQGFRKILHSLKLSKSRILYFRPIYFSILLYVGQLKHKK
jgi:hypothetical protein